MVFLAARINHMYSLKTPVTLTHSQHVSIFFIHFFYFLKDHTLVLPHPKKNNKKTNYKITKTLFDPKIKKISLKGKLVF